jgi:cathepsin B
MLNAYEGVQIKHFGLGLNRMSDAKKQAYLIELMASSEPSSTATRADAAGNAEVQEQWTGEYSPPQSDGNTTDAASLLSIDKLARATTAAPIETHAPLNASTKHELPVNLSRSPPAAGRRRVAGSVSSAAGFTPPAAFDARDTRKGQVPCQAYQVLNQGGCGACYAFAVAAAFSARVCRADPAASVRNVVVSPQSLLDCNGGCDGGNVLATFASLVSRPPVELWCDPYAGARQACGSACGSGNAYGALAGSVRQVGGAGAQGRRQMQLELVRGGPGVLTFTVMSDLFAYSRGVYSPSRSARVVAGHAVSLVGWGVDRGVPYWLCQNSWGAGWGERGFFRIVRGADACGIESSSGLVVARPLAKHRCAASNCFHLATTRRDCTCKCPFGRTGPRCMACALKCRNGASRVDDCTRCECKPGFWGRECEGGYRLSSLASCARDAPSKVTVSYSFTASVPSPTQLSFVGIYRLGEVGPFNSLASAPVCGATYPSYSRAVNGGLCPSSGSFKLSRPTKPGKFKVVVVPWSPRNALGQQG